MPFLADPGGCALCNQLMAGIAGSNLADGVMSVCGVGSGLCDELITSLEERTPILNSVATLQARTVPGCVFPGPSAAAPQTQ